MNPIAATVLILLKIVGVIVCYGKAKALNRNKVGWGFFGFISPILAMIWVHCMKPFVVWDMNLEMEKEKGVQN